MNTLQQTAQEVTGIIAQNFPDEMYDVSVQPFGGVDHVTVHIGWNQESDHLSMDGRTYKFENPVGDALWNLVKDRFAVPVIILSRGLA